ncbi:hypothetical protein CEY15_10275 [Dietzia natronolimnaea]|uniref:Uncharacterized protein n=2 Tax=Dietzia natronolimnaea TaxID=161920 RepID=A0A2A2WPN6_9ACTN|nr:hypothetical protein CEY15_10275 [Dietzia natronolimnaea]
MLTALVGIVGVVGAVTSTVVTQRIQATNTTKQIDAADKRWMREASERKAEKLREALAELLAPASQFVADASETIYQVEEAASLQGAGRAQAQNRSKKLLDKACSTGRQAFSASLRVRLLNSNQEVREHLDLLEKSVGGIMERLNNTDDAPPEFDALHDAVDKYVTDLGWFMELVEGLHANLDPGPTTRILPDASRETTDQADNGIAADGLPDETV